MAKRYSSFYTFSITALIVIIAISGVSCKDDEQTVNDIGYSYFPTTIGHWVVYEVDSTVYDDFEHDTDYYRYQVKEILESEFIDNSGRPSIRVERYKRWYNPNLAYDSIPWYLSRVWAFTKTNSSAEKLEENERFIRLAFGIDEGKTWDGNAFNTLGEWRYKYKEVDVPYTINTISFDSTLTVEQKKEINWVNHKQYTERYARGVGMIEKNVIDVRDTALNIGVLVVDRIYSGVVYSIKIVDYGPR